MKIQITLLTLIGLTCATIALGKEIKLIHGSQIDTRSLSERANQPNMHQMMAQFDSMQKQMNVLHEALRRNHTRRNSLTVRNIKDAVDEMNRNLNAMNSHFSRFLSTDAAPSVLGTRSFGLASDQQQSATSSAVSAASSSANTQSLA